MSAEKSKLTGDVNSTEGMQSHALAAADKSFHMSPEEFRRHGHAVVDWIADYQSRIEQFPVLSHAKPGEIRAKLPATPPVHAESFEHILADMDRIILPGITHWQSPNFYAYFPSNSSGPGILGDLLSSGLDVQGMLWSTSPSCTELETHVLDWLVSMLGLPEKFLSTSTGGGVIQDTASSASLCALLAARERATQFASNRKGCDGRLVAYCSTQTHSSIEKAIKIAGLGADNLRAISVDENFAMHPEALEQQVAADIKAGLTPCFVCATVGTTSSNAIDPVRAIAQVCEKHKLWLHVDGAMSGTAALCPEFRFIHDGVELADSYTFNPHKWMFTNFDCNCFFVADRKHLIQTLTILPEYLRNQATESGAVIDYRDWHIQLGRRFRSLKLWFVIRHYGVEGLQYHVREHVRLAQRFSSWVRADSRFELMAPVKLNLVCFRLRSGDRSNQVLMERLNSSGDLFLTHTKLEGKFTLRLCIGQTNTQARHVERAWQRILEETSKLGDC
jgi:aromatic-L-amino-acid/L-tryptophan decarboxylase